MNFNKYITILIFLLMLGAMTPTVTAGGDMPPEVPDPTPTPVPGLLDISSEPVLPEVSTPSEPSRTDWLLAITLAALGVSVGLNASLSLILIWWAIQKTPLGMYLSKTFWLFVCLVVLAVAVGWPPPLARAQSGCPVNLEPLTTDTPFEILQAVELAKPIGENTEPYTDPVGVFYQHQVTVNYQGQRVLLSSRNDPLGGALCVDDLLVVRNLTTGKEWRQDFRSADRSQIRRLTDPLDLDISHLFIPGRQVIEITLVDLAPEFHSASGLWLLQVTGQPRLRETASPTFEAPSAAHEAETPDLEAGSSISSESASSPVVSTKPRVPTLTPTPMIAIAKPAAAPPTGGVSVEAQVWPWPLLPSLLVGLGLLVPLLVVGKKITQNGARLGGRVINIVGDQVVGETDLDEQRQSEATFDDQGNIIKSGVGGVARLRAVKAGKRVETWWERLDPDTGEVWDRRVMRDGDEEIVGGIVRLRYESDMDDDELDEGDFDA